MTQRHKRVAVVSIPTRGIEIINRSSKAKRGVDIRRMTRNSFRGPEYLNNRFSSSLCPLAAHSVKIKKIKHGHFIN